MDNPNIKTDYQAIRARLEGDIAYLQIYRPDHNNTINDVLIQECSSILESWKETAKVIVLEGLPQVFCYGADFRGLTDAFKTGAPPEQNPEPLYDLWLNLATGPFVTIAKVKGKVNAGGVGFVAACDVVLAEETVVFSLSELLFSLMPACVLPFLIRRTGWQKAHYMTLMTQPFQASQALMMGLVDVVGTDADDLLRRHLLRLKNLSKMGIVRYKNYMNTLNNSCVLSKNNAIEANKLVFSDTANLKKIAEYVSTGKFPWESDHAK